MQLQTEMPQIWVQSQLGQFDLAARMRGHWSVIAFHPAAFTPVCSTEIAAMARCPYLKCSDTIAFSVTPDTPARNEAWIAETGAQLGVTVRHDCIADTAHELTRLFGLPAFMQTGAGPHGYFIFDPSNRLAAFSILPVEVGFSTLEISRTLAALTLTSQEKAQAPADWTLGAELIDLPAAARPGKTARPATLGARAVNIWDKGVHQRGAARAA